MALRPTPISDREYHDAYLVGLAMPLSRNGGEQRVELTVEDYSGRRFLIRLDGVKHMVAKDVLAGNIIDIVSRHPIADLTVARAVADSFIVFGSQYFPAQMFSDEAELDRMLGMHFIDVWSSYGVKLVAVAKEVSEHSL